MNYAVVIERADRNYSAHVSDLPSCVATGRPIDEVKTRIREAITMHIERLREENLPVPEPTVTVTLVEVGTTSRGKATEFKLDVHGVVH